MLLPTRSAGVAAAVAIWLSVLCAGAATTAVAADLWLAPPDDVMSTAADFHEFFDRPQSWAGAAHRISSFSFNAPYLLKIPPDLARRELSKLHDLGIKLSVALPGMPADKNKCGMNTEGMVWPGEVALAASRIKALGAEIDSFGFDLPLTSGHISREPGACQFSIADAAKRLASEVRGLRKVYPTAKLVDSEVPTGMPAEQWAAILTEWVDAFRQESGENLYGVTMDVWWKFPWHDTVRRTAQILGARGIATGVFIDASAGPELTAAAWIADSKRNFCELRDTGIPMNYNVVSNWLDMRVKSLPETDPQTLTALVDWVGAGGACMR